NVLDDIGHGLVGVDALLHEPPQVHEVVLLLLQQVLAGDGAVAGADQADVELLHALQGPDPRGRVGMAHEVEGAIDAGVAGAEDLVLRQVGAGTAGGVGVAEEQELDALRAVVEDELVVEDDVGHLEAAFADVLAAAGAAAGLGELLWAVDAQQAGAVGL